MAASAKQNIKPLECPPDIFCPVVKEVWYILSTSSWSKPEPMLRIAAVRVFRMIALLSDWLYTELIMAQ